jgi:hypothetical protein
VLLVVETGDQLEVTSLMPAGKRVLFFILALVPLLAPYELLLKPGWESILNPYFGFAAIVSLGAMLVSGFLVWAAIAGIESSARFNLRQGTLSTLWWAPVIPLRAQKYSLNDLCAIEVETTEWTDGPPSHLLNLETADGRAFKLLGGYDRGEVEAVRRQIGRFLSQPSGC